MYKVKGKVRKPTPAMREVLDEMKAGQKLFSFYSLNQDGKEKWRIYRQGAGEIPKSTVKGLVDRYLIQETTYRELLGNGNYRTLFILLDQKKPGGSS